MEKDNVLKILMQNYIKMEASIVEQLKFSVTYDATIGVYRENVWKSLFKQIIPKKFIIEQSVFIIDSKRNVANEVALVIFKYLYKEKQKNNGAENEREEACKENENAILSLIFTLNQLLMLINNPIPFPHRSYVELFNQIGREGFEL